MEDDFIKYIIKKPVWWDNGNYKIFDENGTLCFTTKNKLFEIRKKIRLLDKNGAECLLIESKNSWNNNFIVTESGREIMNISKKFLSSDCLVILDIPNVGNVKVKTNVWRTNFTFFQAENEIARLSFKTWSKGEAGLVIKPGNEDRFYLAASLLIAYFNQSGQV